MPRPLSLVAIKAGIKAGGGIFACGVEKQSTGLESLPDPSDIVQSAAVPVMRVLWTVVSLPLESPEREFKPEPEPGIEAVGEGKEPRASKSG
ncbi:MAG: hypothetical protein CL912_02040 [Deltaproteobacteria bacterium]|nr:hypothetical protein [Deltaproteobacteria bacterium]